MSPGDHRAGGGNLDGLAGGGSGGLFQGGKEGLGRLGGKVLEVVIVDLNHGGVDTGAQTLNLGESEETVFGGVAGGDAEVLGHSVDNDLATAAAELAWCLSVSGHQHGVI